MEWTQRINEMAWGFKNSAILLNSLRAGIFESLGHESKSSAAVALDCGLNARATDVVMHALVATEVLEKNGGVFSIASGARPLLLADSPTTLKSILGHNLFMMRNWAHLDEALQTGAPVRKEEQSQQQLEDFILGMENVSRLSSKEVAAKVDLSQAQLLLDLGGGPGTAALTFAEAHPHLHCVVFDLPGPIEIAKQQIKAAGLEDRVRVATGDFHADALGDGFDVVYISNIIHMMDPQHTLQLLKKAAAALNPGGRLMLKDFFLEECLTEPKSGAQFSVNMLVNTKGGKTYTRVETMELLNEAGFEYQKSVTVGTQSELVIGVKRA